MIKFFRTIRQRFVTENRLSKYLLYAIGEIPLVVIGILLALQINNWNEDRKNTDKENRYLSNINRDILDDSLYLENTWFKNRQRKIEALLATREYVTGDYTPTDAKAFTNNVSLGGIYSYFYFGGSSRAYQELLSTGNLSLISNDSIRNQIVNYYVAKHSLENYIDNIRSDYSSYMNSLKAYNPSYPDSINIGEIPRILHKIKTDEFHSLINQELTYSYSVDRQLDRLKSGANVLHQEIRRYLNDHSE